MSCVNFFQAVNDVAIDGEVFVVEGGEPAEVSRRMFHKLLCIKNEDSMVDQVLPEVRCHQ